MALVPGATNGADALRGTAGDDDLDGLQGNDALEGGAGDDRYKFRPGDGFDIITDTAGNDEIQFENFAPDDIIRLFRGTGAPIGVLTNYTQNDLFIFYGQKDDYIKIVNFFNGNGAIEQLRLGAQDTASLVGDFLPFIATRVYNSIIGTSNKDIMFAADVATTLAGGAGDDRIGGGIGADVLSGDDGDDTISGGDAGDAIQGGNGADQLAGDAGSDQVLGGEGNDLLLGGEGDDTLTGGVGDDELNGGVGIDTYLLSKGDGEDEITDADASSVIRLQRGVDEETVRLVRNVGENGTPGEGFTLFYGDGDSVKLNTLPQIFLPDGGLVATNVFTGTEDNDAALLGTGNADTIRGLGGADVLDGLAGDDLLEGGAGTDTLRGSVGTDRLNGGDGDDTYLIGIGQGVETISDSGGAADRIQFGPGIRFEDVKVDASGVDLVLTYRTTGGALTTINLTDKALAGGIEQLRFEGDSNVYVRQGDSFVPGDVDVPPPPTSANPDIVQGDEGNNTIEGLAGNDTLFGLAGDDVLIGGEGNDLVIGNTGEDRLEGSAGDDTLDGAPGNDLLLGGDGSDFLKGGLDDDDLSGGAGLDKLFGGVGDDTLSGDGNDDLVRGGVDDDTVRGDAGNDDVDGGSGDDIVEGGTGDDEVRGGTGSDTLRGDDGSDKLFGSFGDDVLEGGAGADQLRGGAGNDVLDGGADEDIAFFNGAQAQYQITVNADGSRTISHIIPGGIDGTDVLRNIEFLNFNGVQVPLS